MVFAMAKVSHLEFVIDCFVFCFIFELLQFAPSQQSCIFTDSGSCRVTDPLGDSGRPFCTCQYGFLGQACEHAVVPRVSIVAPELILSDRPATFGIRISGESAIKGVDWSQLETASVTWVMTRADSDPVKVTGVKEFTRQLQASAAGVAGLVSIAVRVTFPHSDMIAENNMDVRVLDCFCSGRGKCTDRGVCVCRSGFTGEACNNLPMKGSISVRAPAAAGESKTIYADFPYNLFSTPSSFAITLQPAAGSSLTSVSHVAATVVQLDAVGVTIRLTNDPEATETTHLNAPLTISYSGSAQVTPAAQSGRIDIPAAPNGGPQMVTVQFPELWGEAPFVSAKVVSACCGLSFKYVQPQSSPQKMS